MTELKCEYHPERDAVEKCERCNRLICLQDKQVVRNQHRHYSSTSSFDHYSYTQMVVCPLCYADIYHETEQTIRKVSGSMKIGGIIFGTIFLGAVFFAFTQFLSFNERFEEAGGDSSFGIFPFVVFGIMALVAVLFVFLAVKGPSTVSNTVSKQADLARQRKEKFLQSVNNQSFASSFRQSYQLTCYQCGSVIDNDAMFCPSCGDPTDEERQDKPMK